MDGRPFRCGWRKEDKYNSRSLRDDNQNAKAKANADAKANANAKANAKAK
jgi:hypothetical protein